MCPDPEWMSGCGCGPKCADPERVCGVSVGVSVRILRGFVGVGLVVRILSGCLGMGVCFIVRVLMWLWAWVWA